MKNRLIKKSSAQERNIIWILIEWNQVKTVKIRPRWRFLSLIAVTTKTQLWRKRRDTGTHVDLWWKELQSTWCSLCSKHCIEWIHNSRHLIENNTTTRPWPKLFLDAQWFTLPRYTDLQNLWYAKAGPKQDKHRQATIRQQRQNGPSRQQFVSERLERLQLAKATKQRDSQQHQLQLHLQGSGPNLNQAQPADQPSESEQSLDSYSRWSLPAGWRVSRRAIATDYLYQ